MQIHPIKALGNLLGIGKHEGTSKGKMGMKHTVTYNRAARDSGNGLNFVKLSQSSENISENPEVKNLPPEIVIEKAPKKSLMTKVGEKLGFKRKDESHKEELRTFKQNPSEVSEPKTYDLSNDDLLEYDRESAEKFLNSRPNGSFFVRGASNEDFINKGLPTGDEGNWVALSYKKEGKVGHVIFPMGKPENAFSDVQKVLQQIGLK